MTGSSRTNVSLRDRFEAKFYPVPWSGCWIWMATCDQDGYGRFRVDRARMPRAHVVSYELYRAAVPDGLFVLHTCDVPQCVNPSHLYLGTKKDNARDRDSRGRHWRDRDPEAFAQHVKTLIASRDTAGEQNHKNKLTADAARAIRSVSRPNPEIARQHGVTTPTVWKIKAGRSWLSA